MPRVLMLSADFVPRPWSGIGVAVARQARALAEIGVEVHVVVASRGELPRADEPGSLHLYRLVRSHFPIDPRGFDWVHVHSLQLADLALEIRNRFQVKLVCTVHGWPHIEQEGTLDGVRWSRVQQRLLRGCDYVVFLSRAEYDLGVSLVPEVAGRSSIIAHGVPPPTSAARDRRRGPVVFAGRFAASKGISLLTETARRLLERGQVSIVIAGGHGDGPGTAAVARLAARFPSACLVPGWLETEHLEELFGEASVVLVPSAYEPFGLVALEAMRMGAPVVAADVGGLRDIVNERSGGRRIDSRDPGVWARAALELLDDPETATALSRRGPAEVARRFSQSAAAERLVREVYQISPATLVLPETARCPELPSS
jgi:1,4-alpha-glucan branching enzyme